jgi:hypothetical protein
MAGELSWASSQSSSSGTYVVRASHSSFGSPRLKSLILRAGISPNCGLTVRIPFGRYAVMSVYSKSWDIVTTNHASQRWDVVGKDRRDLLRIRQIVMVLASFLSRGSARPTCSRGGCLQSTQSTMPVFLQT